MIDRIRRAVAGVRRRANEVIPGVAPVVQRPARVGTFHKSGTVLWHNILNDLTAATGLRVWRSDAEPRPARWDVEFHWHSEFQGEPTTATVITVRDPRDLIISAARYHLWAEEPWLDDEGFRSFGYWRERGATYRAALKSFAHERDRLIFEMDHAAGLGVHRMLRAAREPALMVKLETLMEDRDLTTFRACFERLGFDAATTSIALEAAERNSVFSDSFRRTRHVQGAKAEKWREVFDDGLRAAFLERFNDAAAVLGYAPMAPAAQASPATVT